LTLFVFSDNCAAVGRDSADADVLNGGFGVLHTAVPTVVGPLVHYALMHAPSAFACSYFRSCVFKTSCKDAATVKSKLCALQGPKQPALFSQPAVSCIKPVLRAYKQHKRQNPSLNAFICVPQWLGQDGRQWLQGMQLVHTFAPTDAVFHGPDGKLMAAPWSMQLWWDKPVERRLQLTARSPGQLTMRFEGTTINNQRVAVLMDSGASDVFVSKSFCQRAGIPIVPVGSLQVVLGDSSLHAPIVGDSTLLLRMQALRGYVRAFVLENLLPGVDLVLGDAWLRSYSA
jgi:hypothetical protein